jgi:hypothetical protein
MGILREMLGVQDEDCRPQIDQMPGEGEGVAAIVAGTGKNHDRGTTQGPEFFFEGIKSGPAGVFHQDLSGQSEFINCQSVPAGHFLGSGQKGNHLISFT